MEKYNKIFKEEKLDWGWIIDKDYINKKNDPYSVKPRIGVRTKNWNSLDKSGKIRFRCLDDDNIVYYGGWMVENEYGEAQNDVWDWSANDAGCARVQVQRNGKWVQEIA